MIRTRLAPLFALGATSLALATSSGEAKAASVLRVPQDHSTIQAAIDAAAPGDVVSVSPGVYNELIDNHSKAITIESTGGAAVTVIDGLGGALRLTASPGETPVLRGFTVEGGIFTADGPALIENNRVTDDESCSGGMVAYFSGATILSNLITGRSNCSLFRPAIDIGGAGTVRVTRNVITANPGGGVSMNAAGSPTISENTITGNGGSGIFGGNQSDALIVNNLIAGNGYYGIDWLVPSGTRGPIVVNNTIAANSLAAIFMDGFTRSTRVFNNIIVGADNQTVVNCPGSFFEKDPPILEFNDVFSTGTGPLYGGVCTDQTGQNGNIAADPRFIATDDFRLQPGSQAIDAGTSSDAPATDLDGTSRPLDGDGNGTARVDLGAYEAPSVAPAATVSGHGRFGTERNGQVTFTLTNEAVSFERTRGQRFTFAGEVESLSASENVASLQGTGTWSGASGYAFEITVTDNASWGRLEDTIEVVIHDASGAVVFTSFGPHVLKQGDISISLVSSS